MRDHYRNKYTNYVQTVLKEIEKEDSLYQRRGLPTATLPPKTEPSTISKEPQPEESAVVKTKPLRRPGFY